MVVVPRFTEVEVVEVWERRQAGESNRLIGRRLGRSAGSIRAFVESFGGVRPEPRRRSLRHLSLTEREEISRGIAAGEPLCAIADRLGRAPSTISRELARNGGRVGYRAHRADRVAWQRARRPQACKLAANETLRAEVEDKLAIRWSPQQISGWLKHTYPDTEAMHLSHETIYLTLFIQARGGMKRELTQYLRTRRANRRPAVKRAPSGKGRIVDPVMISERPAEVEDRAVPGHWEGDLIMGKRQTAIGTLVERWSRYVMLFGLPDGHTAEAVRDALTETVQQLPEHLWKSLTWDQGKEMAQHAQFTIDTGIQVYFCDPKSPWQRGSNENTNGLLRQYFPKGTDMSKLTKADLDFAAHQLNGRPRQTLGWMTPSEKLAETLQ
ncbi:MAG: IS30 family transposase [Acidobacteria bacterium]|nr:IS30 family transposase [Acidobacteriota bacterium]